MPDRTGRALGSLEPVIFFQNADGYVILPPEEIGNRGIARMMYERKYKDQGWEWKEADTLAEVDKLQARLVEQEVRESTERADRDDMRRETLWQNTGRRLRQRMTSSDCKPFERDFIADYLLLRESKREKYRQRWLEHQSYLWAREMDASTKIEDRMKGEGSL
jgi:hypothetical protein